MVINTYTFIYLFIIIGIGVIWGILMLLAERHSEKSQKKFLCIIQEPILRSRKRTIKTELNGNAFITKFIMDNNHNICNNDYYFSNEPKDLSKNYSSFLNDEIFDKIKVG